MGADGFVVYYGVRETVPDEPEFIDALEAGDHPLLKVASESGLQSWWGLWTDGEEYHVLLGRQIGLFGYEGDSHTALSTQEFQSIVDEVDAALAKHEVRGQPMLHMQFEGQY